MFYLTIQTPEVKANQTIQTTPSRKTYLSAQWRLVDGKLVCIWSAS
ncbi:MAG: hypothetical protein KME35_19750 [Aphanocapsa sp. GSE-SYN-MK-11-07L]|jgi:hypothetical protein|nr:hypothetical protein [Aphanocapsa sp. GSE-SYN-MK-11-07L]